MANSEVSRDFTRRRVRPVEAIYEGLLFAAAAMSVLITVGIVYVLGDGAVHFFSKVPILTFLTDTQWAPLYEQNARFGIAPLVHTFKDVATGADFLTFLRRKLAA
jgi:phosphate transport system permease protein